MTMITRGRIVYVAGYRSSNGAVTDLWLQPGADYSSLISRSIAQLDAFEVVASAFGLDLAEAVVDSCPHLSDYADCDALWDEAHQLAAGAVEQVRAELLRSQARLLEGTPGRRDYSVALGDGLKRDTRNDRVSLSGVIVRRREVSPATKVRASSTAARVKAWLRGRLPIGGYRKVLLDRCVSISSNGSTLTTLTTLSEAA